MIATDSHGTACRRFQRSGRVGLTHLLVFYRSGRELSRRSFTDCMYRFRSLNGTIGSWSTHFAGSWVLIALMSGWLFLTTGCVGLPSGRGALISVNFAPRTDESATESADELEMTPVSIDSELSVPPPSCPIRQPSHDSPAGTHPASDRMPISAMGDDVPGDQQGSGVKPALPPHAETVEVTRSPHAQPGDTVQAVVRLSDQRTRIRDSSRIENVQFVRSRPPNVHQSSSFASGPSLAETCDCVPSECLPGTSHNSSAYAQSLAKLEQRVGQLQDEVGKSRNAMSLLQSSLSQSMREVRKLNEDVGFWRSEVLRLETLMREQHLSDIKSLNQISNALGALLSESTDEPGQAAGE